MSDKLLKVLNELISEGKITDSSLKSIKNNVVLNKLIASEAIEIERKGSGHIWRVKKKEVVIQNRDYYFPNNLDEIDSTKGERYQNIRAMRDSKAKSRKSYRLFFLRSRIDVQFNGQAVSFLDDKPMGGQLDTLMVDKVCFVENLESFMEDDKFIKEGWTLLYVNGRLGKDFLERIDAQEVMHWGDLDYKGLDEYAGVRQIIPSAKLYIPQTYFRDAEKYSMTINTEQKASNRVLELAKKDSQVAKVLEYLHKNNAFLEQEGYSYE